MRDESLHRPVPIAMRHGTHEEALGVVAPAAIRGMAEMGHRVSEDGWWVDWFVSRPEYCCQRKGRDSATIPCSSRSRLFFCDGPQFGAFVSRPKVRPACPCRQQMAFK